MLRQLIDVYEFYGASVVVLMEVPKENISAYVVVDAEPVDHNGTKNRLYRIRNNGGETEGRRMLPAIWQLLPAMNSPLKYLRLLKRLNLARAEKFSRPMA